MIGPEDAGQLPGAEVRLPDDAVLGTVDEVVQQDGAGGATWVSVVPAVGGTEGPVVVPVANAVTEGAALRLPFGEETVLSAPRPETADAMTVDERTELEGWYGAFTSADSAEGWVPPQDLPNVPFTLD